MVPPHFCHQKKRQVGKVNYIQNKETMCLTVKQTDYVYKAVEEEILSILKQRHMKQCKIKMITHTRK